MAKQTPLPGVSTPGIKGGLKAQGGPNLATTDTADHPEPSRRDFLYIATGAVGAVGVALTAWPLVDQMNPDAAALALATVDVDISTVEPGMSLTVKWRGKPVFIRNRTDKEIEDAKSVPVSDLKDPIARNENLPAGSLATDENRAAAGAENFLVQVGICTHLGCVPLGQQGPFGGWFCPCHGSAYDTAGRIRVGPAPENLLIPKYEFVTDTQIRIG